jgi:ankyrin repeat protein
MLLSQSGADLSASDSKGKTPLHHYVENNSPSLQVVHFLENFSSPLTFDGCGRSPLDWIRLKSGSSEEIREIASRLSKADFVEGPCQVPFHLIAAHSVDGQGVVALSGIVPPAIMLRRDDDNPLGFALRSDAGVATVRALIDAGVPLDEPLGTFKMTPLHIAAANSTKVEVVEYLLEMGADQTKRSGLLPKNTALHFSAGEGKSQAVLHVLSENGCKAGLTRWPNAHGELPIDLLWKNKRLAHDGEGSKRLIELTDTCG